VPLLLLLINCSINSSEELPNNINSREDIPILLVAHILRELVFEGETFRSELSQVLVFKVRVKCFLLLFLFKGLTHPFLLINVFNG
jgi:hypothetical protein